jgi:nicotinamide mononucleotide transporter
MDSFRESISQFLFGTGILEWCGVFTGILCVWLAAKNNIWNWPIAIVSVLIYIFIFLETKLYADMGLQVYFFIMNIYGWYFWSKQRNNPEESRPICLITKKEGPLVIQKDGCVFSLHRQFLYSL